MEDVKNKNTLISNWFETYYSDMIKFTYFKTADYEIAENLVQDTFEAIVLGIDKFKSESSPKTWIFSILYNKIKDYYRKNKSELKNSSINESHSEINYDDFFDENGMWKADARPLQWKYDEDNNLLDDQDFINELNKCLQELPSKWYECISMKYLLNYSGEDICKILQINKTNFWQIVHRAKLNLRKCIDFKWFKK